MAEHGLQVVVKFPPGITAEEQGPALLGFELLLRAITKQDVRVVKDLQGDDSKLRRLMTIKMREAL
ncbi:MAG: hypothetical protein Q7J84_18905 [Sulfuricaulis sp.]|nr:hypothetical protein [Sulfuricaulis sp.]